MAEISFADRDFLERLKQRDETAWEAIAEAYLPQLLRAGRGMGFSTDEAQDLAQSVFVALIEGIARFQGRSHIRTFLFGIFYNKVAEHLRARQKDNAHDPIDDVVEERFDASGSWRQAPIGIERQLLSAEIGRLLEECLETVPRAQRIAFYLRDVEELETAEVCKKMGIRPTNLYVLLFRARNHLRECVENSGLRKGRNCRETLETREEVHVHPV
jgi:RNA polymerase sigma-70 factor, ECF subfamily